MEPRQIDLDHAATSPLAPEASRAMDEARRAGLGNPSSLHAAGRRARALLDGSRRGIAQALGARADGPLADRVVFTSGGGEANALAVRGVAEAVAAAGGSRRLLVSRIEHPTVVQLAQRMATLGWLVEWIDADTNGVARLDELRRLLGAGPPPVLVSLQLVNHETGVVQPVAEAARLCGALGVPLHTDAAQAVGKLPIDFAALGVSALTIAPHKFHGPVGVGALILRGGTPCEPLLLGGPQEQGLRAGTEPVELAVGAAAALAAAGADSGRAERMGALRDRLERGVLAACRGTVVVGAAAERAPHLSCIAFRGLDRQAVAMALDLERVACSTGSACASGSREPSPVLLAMGLDGATIRGAVRFSLGAQTTQEEIDAAIARITRVFQRFAGAMGPG